MTMESSSIMRSCTALRTFLLTACVGLPASFAGAQSILTPSHDETSHAATLDTPSMFFEPDVGCGKACAFHAAIDSGLTPAEILPGSTFGPRGPGTDPTNVLNNNLAIEILSVSNNSA